MPSPFLYPGYSSEVGFASSTSPNYFGIVVDNSSNPPGSSPGPYTKKNWDALAQASSSLPSPRQQAVSPNMSQKRLFELAGSNHATRDHHVDYYQEPVAQNMNSRADASSKRSLPQDAGFFSSIQTDRRQGDIDTHRNEMDIDPSNFSPRRAESNKISNPAVKIQSSLNLPISYSPDTYQSGSDSSQPNTNALHENPKLSLPIDSARTSSIKGSPRRAETLPISLGQENANFISAHDCAELLQTAPDQTLLLDVRPYPQFSRSNIMDSLNLCIPTTLLKRPSFNTLKLKDTFISELEKRKFSSWKTCTHIIVYDSNTEHPRDTVPLINVLKKFKAEGWHGEGGMLRGGFAAFTALFPNLIREQRPNGEKPPSKQPRSMSLSLPSVAPIVGGCSLPDTSAAQPFFNNIRQNMDLLGGVGQMPVKLPDSLTSARTKQLPLWLRKASASEDQGHDVSQKFLKIEERELHRMREALTSNADYKQHSSTKFRVAGIEKGSKNRYNDIYPFDHSRVRLEGIPSGHCDYINANYVKAELSNKSYIATQAPVPATFEDFWRVVWGQDVRVIVALTAEVERGQIKCHPYWESGDYGPFKVKILGERRVSMDSKTTKSPAIQDTPSQQPSTSYLKSREGDLHSPSDESPFILVRHFAFSHSSYPFKPIREITQLQYSYWPDFGTTSQPNHLLKLIEQCNKITRMSSGLSLNSDDIQPPGQRPILVHCSAGCGRTGTFCTVDSVLDMLKQQRQGQSSNTASAGTDTNKDWVHNDTIDLVAKTVEDFRTQRPSMVQNLSQFVLCYESILEWIVANTGEELIS
ncbi:protein-tyrosine phosphatase-like protein [Talaromyces proteolyticus]|uniref:protein-tyrosine-phosphatase n=1 Tax=Talaromyces proteolyticus TaxID=1131652 RepID=A0AAD4KGA2_9EURO|nr:protein-tyrosine phosphatase-like protein [Talaromyces proteolyticus]KAH8690971.1 protein-tyrosine phosphatase-like protein [Talaromyces proteolyticus]